MGSGALRQPAAGSGATWNDGDIPSIAGHLHPPLHAQFFEPVGFSHVVIAFEPSEHGPVVKERCARGHALGDTSRMLSLRIRLSHKRNQVFL